jgi:arsenite-transporting ATPase
VTIARPDTRYRCLFLTGKSGVDKTSLARATGVALAKVGKKILIFSTGPASNLNV